MYIIIQNTMGILGQEESFIPLWVTLWVYFMSKIAFYSPSCLLLLDGKKHIECVHYIGIKFN